jgi:hypothetical protein
MHKLIFILLALRAKNQDEILMSIIFRVDSFKEGLDVDIPFVPVLVMIFDMQVHL